MKDDKELKSVLIEKIGLIKNEYPKLAMKEISKTMANKFNVKYGRTIDILNRPETIENMSYDMLYKLMESIRELTTEKYLTLDSSDLYAPKYFTDDEVEYYKHPLEDKEDDFDIIIKDWHETIIDQYRVIHIFSNINEKIHWRNFNKLRFNPETQRDVIEIKSKIKGIPLKRLDINRKAVNNMKELMIKGLYFPVPCIININPDLYEDTVIIRGKELIIPKENHIDLIEGFHNYIAECEVKDENPNWEFPCEFRLMFLNVDRANDFISQMDQKTHFREPQRVRITQSQENYIIDRLNTTSNYHLVGTINNDIKIYLNKLLLKIFNIESREQAVSIFYIIKNNFNLVIEKTDHYKQSFTKEEWFIYLYLIKKSIDSNIDFENIIEKLNISSLLDEIKIRNAPTTTHYGILNDIIKEVMSNGKNV
jgi:hypothetical protein